MNREEGKPRSRDLRERSKSFALTIIRLCTSLPQSLEAQVIAKQLLRCGTSVGAQYREADRARSTSEFISKIESALQELAETEYWLELLTDGKLAASAMTAPLLGEANELTAIFVASINTAKARRNAEREMRNAK